MLSSRYAPVVALAVLAGVVIGVLGWFFAISPQLEQASDMREQEAQVRGNIEVVSAASTRIDQYNELIQADSGVEEAIALNAPSVFDMTAFRSRLNAALSSTSTELAGLTIGSGVQVDDWEVDSNVLASQTVAGLFAQGPVIVGTDSGASESAWLPAVTIQPDEAEPTSSIRMVDVNLQVVGSPEEVFRFLTEMQDPAQQLFQVYSVSMTGRAEGDQVPAGAPADQGDLAVDMLAGLYLHDVDLTVIDENDPATDGPVDDAFVPVGMGQEQP